MKSTRSYLLIVFALALVGTGALAWKQNQELISLRGTSREGRDLALLQRRALDAEQRAKELAAELAAARSNVAAAPAAPANGAAANQAAAARAGRGQQNQQTQQQQQQEAQQRQQQQAALQAVMRSPQYLEAQATQQRAQFELQYGQFARNMGMGADQTAQMQSILAEKEMARQDAIAAAQQAGLTPASGQAYMQFIADAQAQADSNLKALIGDSGYESLVSYNQTAAQRSFVGDFQAVLGSSAPLTGQQMEQLVQIMASNPGTGQRVPTQANVAMNFAVNGGGRGGAAFGGGGGVNGTISTAALAQAQSILTPAQYQALAAVKANQEAQQSIQQLTNQAARGGAAGGRGGATAAPAAPAAGNRNQPAAPAGGGAQQRGGRGGRG